MPFERQRDVLRIVGAHRVELLVERLEAQFDRGSEPLLRFFAAQDFCPGFRRYAR
jgi:hypothetical protein